MHGYKKNKAWKFSYLWTCTLLQIQVIWMLVTSLPTSHDSGHLSDPHNHNPHETIVSQCKDKIPKFGNKYSQKRNIGVSVPISTLMCLWVIYIFPQSVCLFCWRKYVDRSWDYINRSQTHEYGNWGWGRAIPRKGIHKWDFPCSACGLYDCVEFLSPIPAQ